MRAAVATGGRWSRPWLLLCAFLCVASCADERVAGGNSSGTSNTITGRLVDSAGRGADGIRVVARSLRWSLDDSAVAKDVVRYAVTDSAGRFVFDSLPPDAWVVEALEGDCGHLFAPTVSGRAARAVDLGSGVLGWNAPLAGRVHGDSLGVVESGVVHVAGTSHVAHLDASGRFRIDGIPPGVGFLGVAAVSGGLAFQAESTVAITRSRSRDSVLLRASTGADEDYSTWNGLKTAVVDLASASSYLGSAQADVPLLVRIDGTILPEWDMDGASLRFSSGAGRHLSYEIESWNPSTRQALVWVRFDSLFKGSTRQILNMHWGKPGAPGRSSGAAVFPAALGWLGAWHFNGGRPWWNSTERGSTFAREGTHLSSSLDGGLDLDSASRLTLSDAILATTAGVTVSVFIRVDSVLASRAFLFRQGAADSTSFDWAMSLRDTADTLKASFATRRQSGTPAPAKTTATIPRSTWILLGGVFDTASQRVRLELPDDTNRSALAYDTMRVRCPSPKLVVGGGIVGTIDEIRLMYGPVHPDFIRAQWLSWNASSGMIRWQE